ncbi:MAG: flagellar protein FlgN [Candidatus Riflebacteria bacterium]|nr:flagellar protein FlgN [Candidatus Riflebacteria bacterium]
MSASTGRLEKVLSEELAVYRELLVLSEKKRKLLLEKFSTDLLGIVSEEERCIASLVDIEERRRTEITELTGDPETSLETLLLKISEPSIQSAIGKLGRELKETLSHIREINVANQKLLEQALELTQYSLKLLTTPPKDVVYRKPGATTAKTNMPSRLIDRKA